MRGNVSGVDSLSRVNTSINKLLHGRLQISGQVLDKPRVQADFLNGSSVYRVYSQHLFDEGSRASTHIVRNDVLTLGDLGEE